MLWCFFSTQESLVKFVRDSDSPCLCQNDHEKAFDTIEYTTFLSHLYDLEINGKYWRLIKSWYTNPKNILRHNYVTSHSFDVQRGVRQGSVLSPTLFLVVMNFLLQQLEQSGCGLVNPRRACAARVTVVVLSVCMYVCPNTLFWQYAQLEV